MLFLYTPAPPPDGLGRLIPNKSFFLPMEQSASASLCVITSSCHMGRVTGGAASTALLGGHLHSLTEESMERQVMILEDTFTPSNLCPFVICLFAYLLSCLLRVYFESDGYGGWRKGSAVRSSYYSCRRRVQLPAPTSGDFILELQFCGSNTPFWLLQALRKHTFS